MERIVKSLADLVFPGLYVKQQVNALLIAASITETVSASDFLPLDFCVNCPFLLVRKSRTAEILPDTTLNAHRRAAYRVVSARSQKADGIRFLAASVYLDIRLYRGCTVVRHCSLPFAPQYIPQCDINHA